MDLIKLYFPDLSPKQILQFDALLPLYQDWNSKINVISRKDMDAFYTHHVLHSLALTKVLSPPVGEPIVDFGTGGGFPSVPLAIFFPENPVIAIDSIGKKIAVVNGVKEALELDNLEPRIGRVEELKPLSSYFVNRAVSNLPHLIQWVKQLILWKDMSNKGSAAGLYSLKGGDLSEEIFETTHLHPILQTQDWAISNWFQEPYFETKSVLLTRRK